MLKIKKKIIENNIVFFIVEWNLRMYSLVWKKNKKNYDKSKANLLPIPQEGW